MKQRADHAVIATARPAPNRISTGVLVRMQIDLHNTTSR